MKNDTENLMQKINNLITSLEKTNNPTVNFYDTVLAGINSCSSKEDLKKVLDKQLIHSSAIKDYGGYNREQCNSFNEMWKVANAICEDK